MIKVLKNSAYPKSNIENIIVITNEFGFEIVMQNSKKDIIELSVEDELTLTEMLVGHLKEILK